MRPASDRLHRITRSRYATSPRFHLSTSPPLHIVSHQESHFHEQLDRRDRALTSQRFRFRRESCPRQSSVGIPPVAILPAPLLAATSGPCSLNRSVRRIQRAPLFHPPALSVVPKRGIVASCNLSDWWFESLSIAASRSMAIIAAPEDRAGYRGSTVLTRGILGCSSR